MKGTLKDDRIAHTHKNIITSLQCWLLHQYLTVWSNELDILADHIEPLTRLTSVTVSDQIKQVCGHTVWMVITQQTVPLVQTNL